MITAIYIDNERLDLFENEQHPIFKTLSILFDESTINLYPWISFLSNKLFTLIVNYLKLS